MKITPYFELNGNRYEIKKTRWLVAEYQRLNEEAPLSDDDKANAIKANNLVADARKFSEKAEEWWDKLCEDPTEENQRTYMLFKGMSDKAVADYNEFVARNNTLKTAFKHNADILEKVAIKALAEQYFDMNEAEGRRVWELFVESQESHDVVGEWLMAMAQCLFVEEDEEENSGFLSEVRKHNEIAANNRKNGFRKKR